MSARSPSRSPVEFINSRLSQHLRLCQEIGRPGRMSLPMPSPWAAIAAHVEHEDGRAAARRRSCDRRAASACCGASACLVEGTARARGHKQRVSCRHISCVGARRRVSGSPTTNCLVPRGRSPAKNRISALKGKHLLVEADLFLVAAELCQRLAAWPCPRSRRSSRSRPVGIFCSAGAARQA